MIEIKEYPWKINHARDMWGHPNKKTCSYCGKLEYAEYAKRYKFDGVVTILCEGCRKRRLIKKLFKMQGQYIHKEEYIELESQYVYVQEENRLLRQQIMGYEEIIFSKSR